MDPFESIYLESSKYGSVLLPGRQPTHASCGERWYVDDWVKANTLQNVGRMHESVHDPLLLNFSDLTLIHTKNHLALY